MLRFGIRNRPRRLSKAMGRKEDGHGTGPPGRLERMTIIVNSLVRHERIEGSHQYMDEARGYTERLLQIAAQGDKNHEAMDVANYWLKDKDLIHKLFKVLVPRYENYTTCATRMWTLPVEYPGGKNKTSILELKGNPWPPVVPNPRNNSKSLINVLLHNAKKDYRSASKDGTPV
ncbi:hypothetical protein CAPTEDRAFT_227588 [Capitella teleta]|uniref:Large ribosomal subunit protein bL17m n=1 Tax=Capitella teleta TaxID=283909 RepID=R7UA11_CAPTE|nr:hypothetical protein CAPTEDRAFT_227588 [Capitella teleta]|eukprot:ELU02824.1 hypothetical protein CAPTEDRAFT_227588 [Capitella teleta]